MGRGVEITIQNSKCSISVVVDSYTVHVQNSNSCVSFSAIECIGVMCGNWCGRSQTAVQHVLNGSSSGRSRPASEHISVLNGNN